MPINFFHADAVDHRAVLQRLVLARWGVLAGISALALLCQPLIGIALPLLPLFGLLGAMAVINVQVAWRIRQETGISEAELFRQMLLDMVALCAMLVLTGGATNPLVSLLLPPIAIAALSLSGRYVFILVATAIAAYSSLIFIYLPLPVPDAARGARLHLIGMWLTFVVSSAMISWFVLRMTQRIRARDAELADARENALRDERVVALGTLAAGAAHELGTPLGTLAMLAGELAHEPDLPAAVRSDIELMRQQVGACKEIITRLSREAGAARLENASLRAADQWLDEVRLRWHAMRPRANSQLRLVGTLPAPAIVADPRLEQAVHNLLNNAATATPTDAPPIQLILNWSASVIDIEVRDAGPGFPAAVLDSDGRSPMPSHANGQGVGLLLTRAAIEQLGGQLHLSNSTNGGAIARLTLPRMP